MPIANNFLIPTGFITTGFFIGSFVSLGFFGSFAPRGLYLGPFLECAGYFIAFKGYLSNLPQAYPLFEIRVRYFPALLSTVNTEEVGY